MGSLVAAAGWLAGWLAGRLAGWLAAAIVVVVVFPVCRCGRRLCWPFCFRDAVGLQDNPIGDVSARVAIRDTCLNGGPSHDFKWVLDNVCVRACARA